MKYLMSLLFFVSLAQPINAQTDQSCACCTENHQQFDFWVGEWTVTISDGTYAGKNTIKKIQDKCILQENWTSASPGYTGTSFNFYNATTGLWEQLWIDNQGQSLHMTGKRVGDQMILSTEKKKDKEGRTVFHRITWTRNTDGSVRQLWETITNNKDVTVAFDGLYKKVQ
ncbi:MAG: hypothetical protein HKN00_14375 [Flavobacteriaceae bacterium]|nr:hypothetical protein [Bacteroidia bacterium]MBT8286549.1 hypothetical protein [Bacteroidia bacterium]NNF76368.1 hypothetical protein [Flavobacteriaceae bacterium]